jgi:hypothetical protein
MIATGSKWGVVQVDEAVKNKKIVVGFRFADTAFVRIGWVLSYKVGGRTKFKIDCHWSNREESEVEHENPNQVLEAVRNIMKRHLGEDWQIEGKWNCH